MNVPATRFQIFCLFQLLDRAGEVLLRKQNPSRVFMRIYGAIVQLLCTMVLIECRVIFFLFFPNSSEPNMSQGIGRIYGSRRIELLLRPRGVPYLQEGLAGA